VAPNRESITGLAVRDHPAGPTVAVTRGDAVAGTLPYMSPEQVCGDPVLDPGFVDAHAWLGGTYMLRAFFGHGPMAEVLPRAREETARALRGGWLHTRDLASCDADGFHTIRGRLDDLIISGGENIYPREVEAVLCGHPGVREAAVVGSPDPKWGETPCAFVEVKSGARVTEQEILDHCRASLARFKVPRRVVFGPIPKTSTGKIQKFMLRQRALAAKAIE